MPQASDELREEWDEISAYECLISAGLKYDKGIWTNPDKIELNPEQVRALTYLVHEWDEGYEP